MPDNIVSSSEFQARAGLYIERDNAQFFWLTRYLRMNLKRCYLRTLAIYQRMRDEPLVFKNTLHKFHCTN